MILAFCRIVFLFYVILLACVVILFFLIVFTAYVTHCINVPVFITILQ